MLSWRNGVECLLECKGGASKGRWCWPRECVAEKADKSALTDEGGARDAREPRSGEEEEEVEDKGTADADVGSRIEEGEERGMEDEGEEPREEGEGRKTGAPPDPPPPLPLLLPPLPAGCRLRVARRATEVEGEGEALGGGEDNEEGRGTRRGEEKGIGVGLFHCTITAESEYRKLAETPRSSFKEAGVLGTELKHCYQMIKARRFIEIY